MPTILSLMGDYSLVFLGLLAAAAVAAVLYVPVPAKHYAVSALLIAAAASQIYGAGYRASADVWQDKYDRAAAKYEQDLADISAVDMKNQNDALAKAQADASANEARLRADLDLQAAAAAENEQQYQGAIDEINRAAGDADLPAPALILDTIRGHK